MIPRNIEEAVICIFCLCDLCVDCVGCCTLSPAHYEKQMMMLKEQRNPAGFIKNLSDFLAVSGALNDTFLAFSGPWNQEKPFWSFKGPEIAKKVPFQGPENAQKC